MVVAYSEIILLISRCRNSRNVRKRKLQPAEPLFWGRSELGTFRIRSTTVLPTEQGLPVIMSISDHMPLLSVKIYESPKLAGAHGVAIWCNRAEHRGASDRYCTASLFRHESNYESKKHRSIWNTSLRAQTTSFFNDKRFFKKQPPFSPNFIPHVTKS